MTPNTLWKDFERRTAKSLGTVRTPLSGSASRMTASDTLHQHLFVECKHRRVIALVGLFARTSARAARESKVPVLCLHQLDQRGALAVLDWALFVELWQHYAATFPTAPQDPQETTLCKP